jgi:hypothetical protein
MTADPNMVTEEELIKDVDIDENSRKRHQELSKKTDRTEDETKELSELKKNYGKKVQEKIQKYRSDRESERQRAEAAEAKAKEYEERLAKLEKNTKPIELKRETIEVNGKTYYSDDALMQMVERGEITNAEAFKHSKERDKDEIEERITKKIEAKNNQTDEQKIRQADFEKAFSESPECFEKTPDGRQNPKYDPESALYKTANEFYEGGFRYNPRGLTESLKKAKELLGVRSKVGNTDDISLYSPSSPQGRSQTIKKDEVPLTKEEEETSLRLYRDMVNPKTNRQYTETEIYEKAKRAKNERLNSRRAQ